MFRLFTLLCFTSSCSICLAQTPARPAWNVLVEESNLVVLGTVETVSTVIRPDKVTNVTQTLANGDKTLTLPNPSDYIAGRLYGLRVDEVIKKDGGARAGSTISVFVPGSDLTEGTPTFIYGDQFLVFLSPFRFDPKNFAGTITRRYTQVSGAAKETQFDPKSKYIVVERGNGVVRMTSEGRKVVNEVRAVVRTSP